MSDEQVLRDYLLGGKELAPDAEARLAGRLKAPILITVVPDVVLDAVLDELEARGILIDGWEEVFGATSFDEVVAQMVSLSVTRPQQD